MSPVLTDNLHGVLKSLLGLYGAGQPGAAQVAQLGASVDDAIAHAGAAVNAYRDSRGMQAAVAASHENRDGVVVKTVAASGDTSAAGRLRLTGQIADFESRVRAIATIGDTRFSGPALLDAYQNTIAKATTQIGTDVAAVRQQAARIMPVAEPRLTTRRSAAPIRTRRTRRTRRRNFVPTDGTAGSNAVRAAGAYLGTPYVWGGGGSGGPSGGGFDCSGLTQYAVAQASGGQVHLPRSTYEQIYSGERVPASEVRAGDLVFPASSFSSRGPEHVQLAAGNGMVIEAPHSGATVQWSRMPADAVVVRVL